MKEPSEAARAMGPRSARVLERARGRDEGAPSRDERARSGDERAASLEDVLQAACIGTFDWDVGEGRLAGSSHFGGLLGIPGSLPVHPAELLDRLHPADREPVAHAVVQAFADPAAGALHLEYRVGGEGDVRWIRTQGRILRGPDGRAERVLGTVMDVSDRKALETQLIQSQKMESVGRLAGGIAHDFNNLLTAVFGELELARGEAAEGSDLAESLAAIEAAATRARRLTAQLLAFARRQVFELQAADANALIFQLSDLLRRVLGEDVRLSIRAEPDPWRVRVDTHQLEQVILNLAVNAREAMPHGGVLTLETRNGRDGTCPIPGDHVRIAVRDTGAGMDEQVRQRALEPFFTTKELHTGLGLSTCYGIVEQLGGHLSLSSETGRGTEVCVYLPRMEAHRAADARRASAAEGGEVILVVEDEPTVRSMTARGLRKHGYTVLEATHGAAALGILREGSQPVDVLVTDVVMPEMSGRELAERAVALSPGTRVLLVSGHVDRVLARHGLEGEHGVLEKPYTPALLARRVRELLGGAGPPAR